jgi:hypothetical protein
MMKEVIYNGIQQVLILNTFRNPKAKAVYKRFHGTIKNQLCTIFHSNPPQDISDTLDVVNSAIASIVFTSLLVVIHQTPGVSPGGLTLQCMCCILSLS